MRLVIGGYAQGKLHYVLKKYDLPQTCVQEAENCLSPMDAAAGSAAEKADGILIVNHLHRWTRRELEAGREPEQELEAFLRMFPDCILICDEIGSGIVPMDAKEREWRERTGRIMTRLAQDAESVERVVCGIGQILK